MKAQEAVLMIFGKIRRAWLIAFQKKTVEEKLALRRGACSRCGACCKILFKCPAYDESGAEPRCLIYNDRPGVCGLFPIDRADLRERDIVSPGTKCGYWFTDTPKSAGLGPVRWGPTREAGATAKIPNGTLMILKSFFRKPE
jgi:hypothetical protein